MDAGGTRKVWADEIDVLLLLYADGAERLDAMVGELIDGEERNGVAVRKVLRGSWLADRKEHFGFADGIAQPGVRGLRGDDPVAGNAVEPGEILLGHRNEYGRHPVSPKVKEASALLAGADGRPGRDFGRDGSYLVVRQLEQDVPAFWSWVARAAEQTRIGERHPGQDARLVLASKMVGRWPSGAPLALCPHRDDPARGHADDFGYSTDPRGLACPVGAHVRRTNPRDSLDFGDSADDAARNTRRHRLLRRGRTYGEPLVDSMKTDEIAAHPGDGKPRGLLFACLNADIARQFEFVQHTWINNPKFAGLADDADPLMGDHAPTASRSRQAAADPAFTIPANPVRLRASGLQRFVYVRGGAYFFLPSLAALRYLATR